MDTVFPNTAHMFAAFFAFFIQRGAIFDAFRISVRLLYRPIISRGDRAAYLYHSCVWAEIGRRPIAVVRRYAPKGGCGWGGVLSADRADRFPLFGVRCKTFPLKYSPVGFRSNFYFRFFSFPPPAVLWDMGPPLPSCVVMPFRVFFIPKYPPRPIFSAEFSVVRLLKWEKRHTRKSSDA